MVEELLRDVESRLTATLVESRKIGVNVEHVATFQDRPYYFDPAKEALLDENGKQLGPPVDRMFDIKYSDEVPIFRARDKASGRQIFIGEKGQLGEPFKKHRMTTEYGDKAIMEDVSPILGVAAVAEIKDDCDALQLVFFNDMFRQLFGSLTVGVVGAEKEILIFGELDRTDRGADRRNLGPVDFRDSSQSRLAGHGADDRLDFLFHQVAGGCYSLGLVDTGVTNQSDDLSALDPEDKRRWRRTVARTIDRRVLRSDPLDEG